MRSLVLTAAIAGLFISLPAKAADLKDCSQIKNTKRRIICSESNITLLNETLKNANVVINKLGIDVEALKSEKRIKDGSTVRIHTTVWDPRCLRRVNDHDAGVDLDECSAGQPGQNVWKLEIMQ